SEHAQLAVAAARLARSAPRLVELPGPDSPLPAPVVNQVHGSDGAALAGPVSPAGAVVPVADRAADTAPPGGAEERPVLLVYTSGSSGAVRGVPLRQRHITATDEALDGVVRLRPGDVVLQLLPQYHVAGWTVLPLLALSRGVTVVLVPEFEPDEVLEAVGRHGATVTMAVPAMYGMLARSPRFAEVDLTSLRLAICGGAPLPPALLRTWLDRGVPLCQGYGLTEAGPNVLCVPPSDVARSAGSVGVPYPGVEVMLDGAEVGELLVRGPGVFDGYWSGDTGPLDHGWLRTGDLARRDERGWYRIVDRIDEMYTSGGEKVAPAEVEAALREHPAVAEAAVVGVPDDTWGSTGIAFVVSANGSDVDSDALREYCRGRLAGFKVPSRVVTVPRLPRAGIGKVRRDALRAMAVSRT
ncbi:MAG: AMP-binding protein, partial [Actinocatenispora sp.]